MRLSRTSSLLLAAGASALVLLAGSAVIQAQGPADSFVIKNARIVTVTGPVIENGSVAIANGKIVEVGKSVTAPRGARVIDATGLSVYPGMIDSGTEIGLTEISSVAGTVDTTEIGDNNANIHVDVALRPDSSHIAVARVNGITTVLTEPRGGLIAGQSALINLDGWVPKEMILKTPAAMHITWPGANAAGPEFGGQGQRRNVTETRREQDRQVDLLKKIIRQARAYADAKEAREKDPSLPKQDVDLKLEALIPVVRGRLPVVILAVNERDIKNAIAFADEMKIKMILSGGTEAYKLAGELRAKNIPVLI